MGQYSIICYLEMCNLQSIGIPVWPTDLCSVKNKQTQKGHVFTLYRQLLFVFLLHLAWSA